ncbi:phosphonate C-P lyase system protein PhnL [Roseateles sp.]|jgi:alpha-D-ribose 1-methylphosphonate 5-triphosphate synthase subunit PhnL|uniref:phosphonate C-P lyase system protein PhnL n=1 Tax=Roseateles sp. TaxID=1971397 RepID=UPI0037CC22E0
MTYKQPVLDVRGLHKTFTLHLREGLRLPVLNAVSMTVARGECLALVGPSGQGKSTLMKCLYGSYGADGGQLLVNTADGATLDLVKAAPQQVIALRRRALAYVSQFLRVLPRVSALEVVAERAISAGETDEQRAREQAADLLARLNLPQGLWGLPPATFSGGEQQRVNIARGFIAPAELLLLDEPTASLDAMNRRVVIELIEEAKAAGTAIVGIFHDEEVRDAVASRCHTMGAPAPDQHDKEAA